MKLDVIVATYNRHQLLGRALQSLLRAEVPPGHEVRVIVVDNNSADSTRQIVDEYSVKFGGRLTYLFEARQGKSAALNTAIAAAKGDLVGFVDDDEEIDAAWYSTVFDAFADPALDFIGGPYLPRWETPPPDWLPAERLPAIGVIDYSPTPVPYDKNFPGVLAGGNMVLRRSALDKVAPFPENIGPRGARLMRGEDVEIYQRLLAMGARGLYLPALKIVHYIPAERVTRSYLRRWIFWSGVSHSLSDRRQPAAVPRLAGVPRYFFGEAARACAELSRAVFSANGNAAARFSRELTLWKVAGIFYGRHFYRE